MPQPILLNAGSALLLLVLDFHFVVVEPEGFVWVAGVVGPKGLAGTAAGHSYQREGLWVDFVYCRRVHVHFQRSRFGTTCTQDD
jgi:hypothetical protein